MGITPYEIERQNYLDLLDIEDDPSLSLGDLKNLTAGAANVHRAAIIGRLQLDDPIKFAIDQYIDDKGLARKGSVTPIDIYVNASTGSDSNSGFLPSEPLRTLAAVDMLVQHLDVQALPTGVIVNMVGDFYVGHTFRHLRSHIGGIEFRGEPLVDGFPRTKIIMGEASSHFGLRFEPGTGDVIVRNLDIRNFSNGFNGYGILMKEAGILRVEDCRVSGCDIGIAGIEGISGIILGGMVFNCLSAGIRAQYNSNITIGTAAKPVTIRNCPEGVGFSRNSVGHIDYCNFNDNSIVGVKVDMASRVHILGSHFRRNAIGLMVMGAAEWNNNPDTPNNFYERTGDANGQAIQYKGVGRETRLTSQNTVNEYLAFVDAEPVSTNSGNNDALILLGSRFKLPPYFLDVPNRRVRFKIFGRTTANAGNVSIRKTNASGGENELIGEINFGKLGGFIYEIVVTSRGPDAQFRSQVFVQGQKETDSVGNQALTLSSVNDWLFRLYANSREAGESITIDCLEVYLTP